MKELDKKMLKNFRENIAISRLEEEFVMKRAIKKQIMTLSIFGILIISGGFLTVNAATGGDLAEKVKDTIKVVFVNDGGKEEEIKGTTYKDSNGHEIERYEYQKNGIEGSIEIDKNNLDEANFSINATLNEEGSSIVIENRK